MLHSFRLTHQVLIHELYYLLRGFKKKSFDDIFMCILYMIEIMF